MNRSETPFTKLASPLDSKPLAHFFVEEGVHGGAFRQHCACFGLRYGECGWLVVLSVIVYAERVYVVKASDDHL